MPNFGKDNNKMTIRQYQPALQFFDDPEENRIFSSMIDEVAEPINSKTLHDSIKHIYQPRCADCGSSQGAMFLLDKLLWHVDIETCIEVNMVRLSSKIFPSSSGSKTNYPIIKNGESNDAKG